MTPLNSVGATGKSRLWPESRDSKAGRYQTLNQGPPYRSVFTASAGTPSWTSAVAAVSTNSVAPQMKHASSRRSPRG